MTRLGNGRRPLWKKIVLIITLLCLFTILGVLLYLWNVTSPAGGGTYTLNVKPGDSLSLVARTLHTQRIVKNPDALRFFMRWSGTADRLQEGLYDLNGSMTLQAVGRKLAEPPRIPTITVTIPEGRRVKDLPKIFSEVGFQSSKIKSALNNASLSQYTTKQQTNLEGFVFPATYELRKSEEEQVIVEEMVARMEREFTPNRVSQAKTLGLDVRDWVILASMVQAEAANDHEMPVIAGVFLNRLKINDRLRSDPTVAYGLGKDLPELNRYAGDFIKDTPYNTYTRSGLPTAPINNPGEAALLSILNAQRKLPDGRDALFFLHGFNRKIYVNHTFAEHQRDVNQYR